MEIKGDTPVQDIILDQEKRIGTLEVAVQGFLSGFLIISGVKSVVRGIKDLSDLLNKED